MPNRKAISHAWLNRIWYGDSVAYLALLPLSWLYGGVIRSRRWLYDRGFLRSQRASVPVVVVGNITVGGTGKTPVTIWLAQQLAQLGWQPAVVARGYGATVGPVPLSVTADSDPAIVGDEALLMAGHLECPVIVHPDRVAATEAAAATGATVVISDDGLQHYRLKRDAEIAVVDAARAFGNKRMLPAGPLREPISRLSVVDKVVVHQEQKRINVLRRRWDRTELNFRLVPAGVHRVQNGEHRELADFRGQTVHAVAGIGHPTRFFRMLQANGLNVIGHALPDHAPILQTDLNFGDDLPVVMTEKDAVKCRHLDTSGCWYIPVEIRFEDRHAVVLLDAIQGRLKRVKHNPDD